MLKLTISDLRILTFGKYLLEQSRIQSRLPPPLNSVAVMNAQDAIELFLTVLSSKNEINSNNLPFMGYWERLEEKGIELRYKEEMRHLNKCRVSIKHNGTFPSENDINRALDSANEFIYDVVERVMEISIDELSLIQFISFDEVKELLFLAQKLLRQSEFVNSVEKTAEAFSVLLDQYIDSRKVHPWDKPYRFSQISSHDTGFSLTGTTEGKIPGYIDRVSKSIETLNDAVKVLALGIDFDSFEHFKMISPSVYSFAGSERNCYWLTEKREAVSRNPSRAQWALNFVIETAINLSSRTAPVKLTSFDDIFPESLETS